MLNDYSLKILFKRSFPSLLIILVIISGILSAIGYIVSVKALSRQDEQIIQNAAAYAALAIDESQKLVATGAVTELQAKTTLFAMFCGGIQHNGLRLSAHHMGLSSNGYLSIIGENGDILLHPALENMNFSDFKGTDRYRYGVLEDLLEQSRKGGGLVRYMWVDKGQTFAVRKIAYVLHDAEWDWTIIASDTETQLFKTKASMSFISLLMMGSTILLGFVGYKAYQNYAYSRENAIFDAFPHGFLCFDAHGRISSANPAAEEIIETSLNQMLGKTTFDVLGPIYDCNGAQLGLEQFPSRIALSNNKGIRNQVVRFNGCRTGKQKWVRINAILPKERLGTSRQAVFTHFEEITQQIDQDVENRKLVLAIQNSPISTVITDEKGNIEFVNQAFCNHSGYAREEVYGENMRIMRANSSRLTNYHELWKSILSGETWKGEFLNKRRDGTRYIESATIAPLMDHRGAITHFVAVKEDVTEMRKAKKRLEITLKNLERTVRERTREATNARDLAIDSMAILSEFRDFETGNHILRTKFYMKVLLESLEGKHPYGTHEVELIWKSAPLHDIGKVAIPDSILLKPGKLTTEEYDMMKQHVLFGYDALNRAEKVAGSSEHMKFAKEIVVGHHEKWDGTGYPHGLSGNEIPFSARLMAIADVYDALISRRPYKDPLPHETVVQIIQKDASTHFDPFLVEQFLKVSDQFKRISEQHMDL